MNDLRTQADESVVESSTHPEYAAVELGGKPPTAYSYVERRAELLQLIQQAGHPRVLNQTELAERYGVSQQQISKDFDRLGSYVHDQLVNRDRRALIVESVVGRSIEGLLDEGEYRKAARTAMEWDEWITEFHDLDKLHAQVEALERHQEAHQ